MKGVTNFFTGLVVCVSILTCPRFAEAQSWSDAQQKVWQVVTDSWDAIIAEDVAWTDNFVHPNAIVWGDQVPMPRNRAAVKRWDRYNFDNSTTMVSDFSPAAIVVEGSTAVAHYYYSLGSESHSGERKTIHGRCTDVLVSAGGSWKFLSWNCGDEPQDDD